MFTKFKDLYRSDCSPSMVSSWECLTTLMADDRFRGSPGSAMSPRNVVIVYDATKEFDLKPLIWAMENIVHGKCCTVTLLGIMPYLNIPLSIKVWTDIWTCPNKDLSALPEMQEKRKDIKHLKLHAIMEICRKKEVVPRIKTRQGWPRHLIVVEEITKLHPSWVIFDRHHRKDRAYYAAKIPFNMVMMNENGYADMIRGQSMIGECSSFGTTPTESPATLMPTPEFVMSEKLQMDLRKKAELEKQHETEVFIYEI
ncbi:unnamed protein product [Rhodiola kirilowii]